MTRPRTHTAGAGALMRALVTDTQRREALDVHAFVPTRRRWRVLLDGKERLWLRGCSRKAFIHTSKCFVGLLFECSEPRLPFFKIVHVALPARARDKCDASGPHNP